MKRVLVAIIDVLSSPFVLFSCAFMRFIRRVGIWKLKCVERILLFTGIYPITDHYYEPMFNMKYLTHSLEDERELNFSLNEDRQIEFVDSFCYEDELKKFPFDKNTTDGFYYNNGSYEAGDAELLYSIIRKIQPKRMIEIGCGMSTLMALEAEKENERQNGVICEHICIEPYENSWLDSLGVTIIRKRLEEISDDIFDKLEENDILFIDSSHIIRPQGDVLTEYLNIIPKVKEGVYVHVHDIFTPRDYKKDWIEKYRHFWNEQYLLEAFLSCNDSFEVIVALNYLKHNHFETIKKRFPILGANLSKEPASFWMRRKTR